MSKLVGVRILFILLVILMCAPAALADYCLWVCVDEECAHRVYVCSPEYYTVMSAQPSWCLYQQGDRVYMRYDSQFNTTGWYVVSSCDTSAPPSGFNTNPWWVEPGCGLSPWAYC